jgi:hypothetical protein
MYEDALERLRGICRLLPYAVERLSHGAPTFFIKDKRAFVMITNDHHGDGRLALWCAAPPGAQQALSEEGAEWFFMPPYVGCRGWIGVRLDRGLDWQSVAEFVVEGYCTVAPPALAASLDLSPWKRDQDNRA